MLTEHDSHAPPDAWGDATTPEPDRASIGPSDGFAVGSVFDPPRFTIAPRGELDLASVPALEREIEAVPWAELAELVFDLADTTFIDSTGLAVLIRASQRAAAAGLRFSVVHVRRQPRKLFTIAGVTDSLGVQP